MSINPMGIEAVKHILVLHSFILSVLKCGKRYAETVLRVFEIDERVICQRFLNALTLTWTHQYIMDLQIFKIKRNLPYLSHMFRIEDGKSVCTSKNESSV